VSGEVVAVLVRAFFDDPLFAWLVEEGARRQFLEVSFRAAVEGNLAVGEVWTVGAGVQGAAVWMRPGERVLPAGAMGILEALGPKLGEVTERRMGMAFPVLGDCREREAPGDHWFLELLGVEPELQGRGLGGRLLGPVLERADREGHPCYLDTMKARNLPFYRRHGFEVATSGRFEDGGPEYWTMVREPGGGNR
jgi:GNAT superfamily N-acetyltransferase